MSNRPEPQNAIVTGASRGLGFELAKALAERGWRLAVDARGSAALVGYGEEEVLCRYELVIEPLGLLGSARYHTVGSHGDIAHGRGGARRVAAGDRVERALQPAHNCRHVTVQLGHYLHGHAVALLKESQQ